MYPKLTQEKMRDDLNNRIKRLGWENKYKAVLRKRDNLVIIRNLHTGQFGAHGFKPGNEAELESITTEIVIACAFSTKYDPDGY